MVMNLLFFREIEKTKASNFIQLSDWIATDSARNQLILKDILAQVAEGRNILVLVNRIQQIDVFEKLLKEKEVDDCYIRLVRNLVHFIIDDGTN
ncbi:DNA or RNA helicases of superfamily II [Streptococcus pneumoniae]|nr:DNA or RNA helicases of superfamily II [Streptococcus pneumoniae]